MPGGVCVVAHEDPRVWIVHRGKPGGALKADQLVQIEPGPLTDLPDRGDLTVIAERPPRRQQHRGERRPDFLRFEALLEQPGDQLGPLGAGFPGQPVEQAGGLDLRGHDTAGRRPAHGRADSI